MTLPFSLGNSIVERRSFAAIGKLVPGSYRILCGIIRKISCTRRHYTACDQKEHADQKNLYLHTLVCSVVSLL